MHPKNFPCVRCSRRSLLAAVLGGTHIPAFLGADPGGAVSVLSPEDDAFLEEGSARREAERGTFDPSYVVYTAGKLMLLKLRRDYKAQHGSAFSLRTFHDTLLGQGAAPFWAHRQLMLQQPGGDVME